MSIYKYIILALLALPLLASCNKEDDLTPSNADINGFAPEASDNSQTAQIRNVFFKATGAYLLFNDTLVSKSTNGQPELKEQAFSAYHIQFIPSLVLIAPDGTIAYAASSAQEIISQIKAK